MSERNRAKKDGARLHPNSGAGGIKGDASTDDELIEYKDANRTHTLNGQELDDLFRRASRQGRQAIYNIHFRAFDLEAKIWLTRKSL